MNSQNSEDGSDGWHDEQRFPCIWAACRELELHDEVRLHLQAACTGLAAAKAQASEDESPSMIANELRGLSDTLAECVNRLQEMRPEILDEVDERLSSTAVGVALQGVKSKRVERFFAPYAAGLLEILDEAAQVLKDAAQQRPKSGRKPVRGAYGRTVLEVGYALKSANVPISRTGKFRLACDAVWQDAGMPSTPEGAIRYATDEMHDDWKMYGL